MWSLGKFLPLVIGSSIPDDDEKWQHFLLLLKIVDIVFSPITSVDDLGILESYIEDFLWQAVYPHLSVTISNSQDALLGSLSCTYLQVGK
jgi:hypothetical protein